MSIARYSAILARQFFFKLSTNAPYVSGDSIAKLCDYIAFGWFGSSKFDEAASKSAKSIFVRAEQLEELEVFGESLGLRPSVVVTGNSDRNFTVDRANPLGCKLWLCQNNAMTPRPGLATLPIGLENRRLGRLGQKSLFRKSKRRMQTALTRVFVPPMRPTNPERIKAVEEAQRRPDLFHVSREYVHERKYLDRVKDFQFVLCLEGNGFENHRIWECLYLGVFPILLRSRWSQSLTYLDLPLLVVDSLDDVCWELLEDFVARHSNWSPDSSDAIWVNYWRRVLETGHTSVS